MAGFKDFIKRLAKDRNLSDEEFLYILNNDEADGFLFSEADRVRRENYGDSVYIRGLIEFTNYCKNNCYYCGIRRDNKNAIRYSLTKDEILECCEKGYGLGFRTFVLQGGEDLRFSDKDICEIVYDIKSKFSDCAVTLSVGERSKESFKAFYDAGADRYLLRHETATDEHYRKLHPENLSLRARKECLFNLKEIGFQVGSGFMVGSPYQTMENIISDLRFLQELEPDMIGIGPFLTHKDTPFSTFENGSFSLTLKLISVLRLIFPYALIPSTTALGTINPEGREMGLKAGANVVMPNLSPMRVRKLYTLYDNKIATDEEAAESVMALKKRVENAGYRVEVNIGNVKKH